MPFALLAAVASGLLLFLANGRAEIWPLAWIAMAPVLYFAYRSPSLWRTFFAGFVASSLGALDLVLMFAGQLPLGLLLGFDVQIGLLGGVVLLAARALARRLPPTAALFAYPCVAVAAELLVIAFSPDGTAVSAAYSQTRFLQLIQLTSLTGLSGVSFVIALPSSALALFALPVLPAPLAPAAAVDRRHPQGRRPWRAVALAAILAAVLFAVPLLFGAYRLLHAHHPPEMPIALVAIDAVHGARAETVADALRVVHAFTEAVHRAATQHTVYVALLPEKFVATRPAWEATVRAALSDAARRDHLILIAGLNQLQPTGPRNVAAIFRDDDGPPFPDYLKRHLVPGLEDDYTPGDRPGDFVRHYGVAICKDLDFTDVGRQSALANVRLLFVPAWDFGTDGWIHARRAIVRGIESGFSVARTAADGRLTLTDAYGHLRGSLRSDTLGGAVLTGGLPPGPGPTFYARHPYLFSIAVCVLLAALTVVAVSRGVES